MQAHEITYPSSVGTVVNTVRMYLAWRGWENVTVLPELPAKKAARMVTVRDDGGIGRNGVLPRRHGFNVWADNPVDADALARAVADACRVKLHATEVSGPVEVSDDTDDALLVGKKPLTHYFLSATIIVRARNL